MKRNQLIRYTFRTLCGLILTAALLASCAFPGSPSNGGGIPFPFRPETETETETETADPVPQEPEEPVVRFSPFGEDAVFATIREGPEDTILIMLEPYSEEFSGDGPDGQEEDRSGSYAVRNSKTLLIYDPFWGKCIRTITVPFAATLCDHVFDDGTFAVSCSDGESGASVTFYDAAGQEKGSLRFEEAPFCYVTSDKKNAYFAAGELMRQDLETGEVEKVPLPGYMQVSEIRGMLSDSDCLLLSLPSEPYGYDVCTGLFDPDAGRFVFLRRDYYSWNGPSGRSVIIGPDPEGGTEFLFWDGSSLRKLEVPPATAYGEASLDGRFCLVHFDDEKKDILCSPSDNTFADFRESEELASGFLYLERFDALFCLERNGDGKLVPTLIRRDFLPYSESSVPLSETADPMVDETVLSAYAEAKAAETLSSHLSACRERANELEEKYGIRILLSDECALRSQKAGFRVHPSSEWSPDTEAEFIRNSLDVMDQLFSQYPLDFFSHFDKGPANGLIFMLTGAIESTYNVIAYERYEFNSRCYEVVFDMSYLYDLKCTLIHELWHAVEDSTSKDFPYDEWNAVSPPGFAYQEAYENTEPVEGWTLFGSDPEDIYFVDEYSKTYAKEDRARIIEYFFGREELRGDLLAAPHLVEKYRILTGHIRRTVGTAGWPERTAWEILP